MSKLAEDLLDCVLWAAVISLGYLVYSFETPAPVVVEVEAECEPFDPSELECRISLLEEQIEDALRPYRLHVAREHEGRKPQVRRIRRAE